MHALHLLNKADLNTKCNVCIYLDQVFARKFKAEWAVAVADTLKMSLKTHSANIALCRRSVWLIFPTLHTLIYFVSSCCTISSMVVVFEEVLL